jgi:hypothetical protein
MFTRPSIETVQIRDSCYNSLVCVMPVATNSESDTKLHVPREGLRALMTHLTAELVFMHVAHIQTVCVRDAFDEWRTGCGNDLCVALLVGVPQAKQHSILMRDFRTILRRFKGNLLAQHVAEDSLEWIEGICARLEPLTVRQRSLLEAEFERIEAQVLAHAAAQKACFDDTTADVWSKTYAIMDRIEPAPSADWQVVSVAPSTLDTVKLETIRRQPAAPSQELVSLAAVGKLHHSVSQYEEFYGCPYDLSLCSDVLKLSNFGSLSAVCPSKFAMPDQIAVIRSMWHNAEATAEDIVSILQVAKELADKQLIPKLNRQNEIGRARAVLAVQGVEVGTSELRPLKASIDVILCDSTTQCLTCNKRLSPSLQTLGYDGTQFCSWDCNRSFVSRPICNKCKKSEPSTVPYVCGSCGDTLLVQTPFPFPSLLSTLS